MGRDQVFHETTECSVYSRMCTDIVDSVPRAAYEPAPQRKVKHGISADFIIKLEEEIEVWESVIA